MLVRVQFAHTATHVMQASGFPSTAYFFFSMLSLTLSIIGNSWMSVVDGG